MPVLGFQLKMGHSQIQAHLACATSAVIMASTMYGDPKFIFFEARQSCSNAVANMGKIQIDSLPLINTILVFAAQNPHITVNIVCWSALVRHSIWPLVWHRISPTLTFSWLPLHIGNVACGDQRTGNWMMSLGAFEAKVPAMRAFAPQVLDALLLVFFPTGGLFVGSAHVLRRLFRTKQNSRRLKVPGDVNVVPPGTDPMPDTAVGPNGGAAFPVYYDDDKRRDTPYELWSRNDPDDYRNYYEQVTISRNFAVVLDAGGSILRAAASSRKAHDDEDRAISLNFAAVLAADGIIVRTAAASMAAHDAEVRAISRNFAAVPGADGSFVRAAASSMAAHGSEVRAISCNFAAVLTADGSVLRTAAPSMATHECEERAISRNFAAVLAADGSVLRTAASSMAVHDARKRASPPVSRQCRHKQPRCDHRDGRDGKFCTLCGNPRHNAVNGSRCDHSGANAGTGEFGQLYGSARSSR